ncbi:MAG: HAMP domain-containing sensor histidine kinase [Pseudomonadota bacterium]
MLKKLFKSLTENQSSDKKSLNEEEYKHIDGYLLRELKYTSSMMVLLFGSYIVYYGIYDIQVLYAGLLYGLTILWPIATLNLRNIEFKEISYKFIISLSFMYMCYISGGVFSPVFTNVIFLFINLTPHSYLINSRYVDGFAILWGVVTISVICSYHLFNVLPPPVLPFYEQFFGTLLVFFGVFFKMYLIDRFSRVPISTLKDQLERNKERNSELQKARDSALELSKAKSTFLAQMSHELRTPLNAIIGFSEIMKLQMLGEMQEEYKEYAESIHKSGNHLLNIVNDILDMAKLESGKFQANITEFDPLEPVLQVTKTLAPLANNKNITIVMNQNITDGFKLSSDLKSIVQILMNLIANAVKYCPSSSIIYISVLTTDAFKIRYIVSDNGDGFPQKVIDNFGTPFNLDVNPMHNNTASSGLGLSITKKITEALQGDIFASNNEDGGATVVVTLPNYSEENIVPRNKKPQAA